MTVTYQQLLHRVVAAFKQGSVTVWCGAGACVPSGLPEVGSFVKQVAGLLDVTDDEQRAITNSIPRRLPFEHFVELVVANMDENARTDLLALFRIGSPCHYHEFVAETARRRFVCAVVTTNFDRHIEDAFDQQTLEHDSEYRVYYKTDHLKHIDWKGRHVPVVKLHGSVDDIEQLGVTLRRVAAPGASERIAPAIRHVFGSGPTKCVLVFGYSFSDRFDIVPVIRGQLEQGDLPTLVILDYKAGQQPRVERIEGKAAHPLRDYPGGLIVEGDSLQVVQAIASRLELTVPRKEHPPAWRGFIADYLAHLDTRNQGVARPHLAGTLLEAVGHHEAALRYFTKAVEIADSTDQARWRYGTRVASAGPMIRLGRAPEATSVLKEAIDLGSAAWGGQHLDVALARMAEVQLDSGFAAIQEALSLYEKSRTIAARGPDQLREVPYLSGVATCWIRLGDLDAAQKAYGRALQLVESSGDLFRKAEVYGNIASLASIMRDYRAARDWYEKAIDLSRLAGDQEKVGLHTMNLGNVEVKEGRFEKAIERYDKARELLIPFKPATDPYLALIEKHAGTARRAQQRRPGA